MIPNQPANPRRRIKLAFIGLFLVALVLFFIYGPIKNFASLLYPPIPDEYIPYITEAAAFCGVPKERRGLIAALIWKESTFHYTSVSGAGAVGLTQVLRGTAKGIADDRQIGGLNAQSITDPQLNIKLGACYLDEKVQELGGWDNPAAVEGALIAYNAGPARGRSFVNGNYNGPTSSLGYAKRILEAENTYRNDFLQADIKIQSQGPTTESLFKDVRQSVWKLLLNQPT